MSILGLFFQTSLAGEGVGVEAPVRGSKDPLTIQELEPMKKDPILTNPLKRVPAIRAGDVAVRKLRDLQVGR